MEIDKIGNFVLEEKLPHQGEYGKTYLGYHEKTNQKVAIKIVQFNNYSPEEIRFVKNEGRHLEKMLGIKGIARIVESGRIDDYFYVATEFIEGITLREWLDSLPDHRPSILQTVDIIRKVARFLTHIHANLVAHRDIKPANIMLRKGSLEPVIIDFGSSVSSDDTSTHSNNIVLGTASYIAPELIQQLPGLRLQADIFSLGVIFYEMLTGHNPCLDRVTHTEHSIDKPTKRLGDEIRCHEILTNMEPARSRSPLVDAKLSGICDISKHKNFEKRYASADDFANELDRWRHRRKRNLLLTMSLCAVLVFLAAWGVTIVASKPTPDRQKNVILHQTFKPLVPDDVSPVLIHPNLRFKDHFDDEAFSKKLWMIHIPEITQPFKHRVEPTDVYMDGSRMILINRGYMVTREDFPQGASIQFKWMWTGGRGTYCDDLVVALRTTGQPNEKWPHEVQDGISVRFSPNAGKISLTEQPSGNTIETVLGLALTRNDWHDIIISDDGKNIHIYFNTDSPVLQISCKYVGKKNHLAFYNREPVSAINKQSAIDDVTIFCPLK